MFSGRKLENVAHDNLFLDANDAGQPVVARVHLRHFRSEVASARPDLRSLVLRLIFPSLKDSLFDSRDFRLYISEYATHAMTSTKRTTTHLQPL